MCLKCSISGTGLSVLLLLANFGCQNPAVKPVEVLQRFASGEISRRHLEVNGKKEGTMTEYYLNGKMRSERLFKNDTQIGQTVFYYQGGQIKEIQFFDKNGLKQGADSTFYEDGRLQLLLQFEKGKKHGYL